MVASAPYLCIPPESRISIVIETFLHEKNCATFIVSSVAILFCILSVQSTLKRVNVNDDDNDCMMIISISHQKGTVQYPHL